MKRKIVGILTASALLIGALAGCTSKPAETTVPKETITIDGYTFNGCYDSKEMKSIAGNAYQATEGSKTICDQYSGMGITLTNELSKARENESGKVDILVTPSGIIVSYYPQKLLNQFPSDEEMESMSDEEMLDLMEKVDNDSIVLFAVLKEVAGSDSYDFIQELKEQCTTTEKLLEYDEATYYFSYTNDFAAYTLTEEEKAEMNRFSSELQFVKDNLCLFTPVESEESNTFEGTLNEFSATTMSGKKIDQSVFADYDITMVNIWATWCGYCVEELPGIQKLYEQLPKNVNIISICTDASTEADLAQSMIDEAGVQFETLVDNKELKKNFTQYCSALPVTVFVDSKGNVVGNVQVGLPGEDVVKGYSELIDQALNEIGKGE